MHQLVSRLGGFIFFLVILAGADAALAADDPFICGTAAEKWKRLSDEMNQDAVKAFLATLPKACSNLQRTVIANLPKKVETDASPPKRSETIKIRKHFRHTTTSIPDASTETSDADDTNLKVTTDPKADSPPITDQYIQMESSSGPALKLVSSDITFSNPVSWIRNDKKTVYTLMNFDTSKPVHLFVTPEYGSFEVTVAGVPCKVEKNINNIAGLTHWSGMPDMSALVNKETLGGHELIGIGAICPFEPHPGDKVHLKSSFLMAIEKKLVNLLIDVDLPVITNGNG